MKKSARGRWPLERGGGLAGPLMISVMSNTIISVVIILIIIFLSHRSNIDSERNEQSILLIVLQQFPLLFRVETLIYFHIPAASL